MIMPEAKTSEAPVMSWSLLKRARRRGYEHGIDNGADADERQIKHGITKFVSPEQVTGNDRGNSAHITLAKKVEADTAKNGGQQSRGVACA